MHHKAILTVGTATGKPYHIQCACGSAGDFPKEEGAVNFFTMHKSRLGPTETAELVVPGAAKKAATPPTKPAPPPAPKVEAKK